MPHHENLVFATGDGVQEGDEISDDVEGGVAVGRSVGVAVAAEVGGDGSESEGGEGEDLVAPGVPELGEAMAEEDEWGRPPCSPRGS